MSVYAVGHFWDIRMTPDIARYQAIAHLRTENAAGWIAFVPGEEVAA